MFGVNTLKIKVTVWNFEKINIETKHFLSRITISIYWSDKLYAKWPEVFLGVLAQGWRQATSNACVYLLTNKRNKKRYVENFGNVSIVWQNTGIQSLTEKVFEYSSF